MIKINSRENSIQCELRRRGYRSNTEIRYHRCVQTIDKILAYTKVAANCNSICTVEVTTTFELKWN